MLIADDDQGAGPSRWRPSFGPTVPSVDDSDDDSDDADARETNPLRWWINRLPHFDLRLLDDDDDAAFLDVDPAFLAGDTPVANGDVDQEAGFANDEDEEVTVCGAENASTAPRAHCKRRRRLRKVVTRLVFVSPRYTAFVYYFLTYQVLFHLST